MNDKIKELLKNAEQSDAIAQNKWRIENREQLRKERKEKLKELMEKDKQQTAMQEHIAWLKKQLQQCIDDGYSESWIYAYQLAIDNAESMLDKEKAQAQHWFKFGMLLVEGHLWKPLDKFEQYYNENHEQNNQSNQEHI